jgi:hypothetical protein
MPRPAFASKLRLNYSKTWTKVLSYVRQPRLIAPAPTPAHLVDALTPQQTVKLPQLKGNLVHTLKEILRIFIANWTAARAPINLAIQTTRAALAKAGNNRDPKTAYRHILALIEYGFLRGKVQVKGGLQLLLNPDLLVFDAAPGTPSGAAPAALGLTPAALTGQAAPTLAAGLAGLLAAAQNLNGQMWKTS